MILAPGWAWLQAAVHGPESQPARRGATQGRDRRERKGLGEGREGKEKQGREERTGLVPRDMRASSSDHFLDTHKNENEYAFFPLMWIAVW